MKTRAVWVVITLLLFTFPATASASPNSSPSNPRMAPSPVWSSGMAMYYDAGIMEYVALVNRRSLAGYKDGVAMMSPADVGSTVWLRRPGSNWEGPYLVVDCAAPWDARKNVLESNDVVEVGYRTAQRWKMNRPVEVEVSKLSPDELFGSAVDYRSWWVLQSSP